MAGSYPTHGGGRLRRRALFFLLYACEGAPIGFLWWALPVVLQERGVGDVETGDLLGLLALPWALKFLWAPAVDVLRGPRFDLGAWILAAQAAMVLTLLGFQAVGGADGSGWRAGGLVTGLLLAHAVAAATQDVAIDALAIRETPRDELGDVNGWMQAGMLLARAAFGGGYLLVRPHVGDRVGVWLLVGTIAVGGVAFALLHRPVPGHSRPLRTEQAWRAFARTLSSALSRRGTWVALAFAATAGAGFEAVGAFAGRLLRARGLGLDALAWQFAAQAGLLALGALAGGRLADRLGRRRATALAGGVLATAVLVLAWASAEGRATSPTALLVVLEAIYLSIGLFTASSYALFMEATDPRLGSTQFSAYMGATNLCEAWAAAAAGRMIAGAGHGPAFAALAAVSLAALFLLPYVRPAPDAPPTT